MQSALDLSKVDPPVWRVLNQNTAYGPYTLGQMTAFIAEGRIGLHTKVAEGDGAAFVEAETIPSLQPALREKTIGIDSTTQEDDGKLHNYLVITRLSGSSDDVIMHTLNSFGNFGEAMPGIFVLRSSSRMATIQKALSSITGARDKVLIVDASANRLGWFNLGPEADVHLRSLWGKPGE